VVPAPPAVDPADPVVPAVLLPVPAAPFVPAAPLVFPVPVVPAAPLLFPVPLFPPPDPGPQAAPASAAKATSETSLISFLLTIGLR